MPIYWLYTITDYSINNCEHSRQHRSKGNTPSQWSLDCAMDFMCLLLHAVVAVFSPYDNKIVSTCRNN